MLKGWSRSAQLLSAASNAPTSSPMPSREAGSCMGAKLPQAQELPEMHPEWNRGAPCRIAGRTENANRR